MFTYKLKCPDIVLKMHCSLENVFWFESNYRQIWQVWILCNIFSFILIYIICVSNALSLHSFDVIRYSANMIYLSSCLISIIQRMGLLYTVEDGLIQRFVDLWTDLELKLLYSTCSSDPKHLTCSIHILCDTGMWISCIQRIDEVLLAREGANLSYWSDCSVASVRFMRV